MMKRLVLILLTAAGIVAPVISGRASAAQLRIGVFGLFHPTELVLAPAGELGCHPKHMTEEQFVIGRGVRKRYQVLARDDQEVNRRLRVDVFEGDGAFIFVDDLAGRLAGDNAAEEAGLHNKRSRGIATNNSSWRRPFRGPMPLIGPRNLHVAGPKSRFLPFASRRVGMTAFRSSRKKASGTLH